MNRRSFCFSTSAALTGLAGATLFPKIAFSSPTTLSWVSPARINLVHSYVLAGVAKGWFKDEGLNVDIRVGTGTAQSVIQVASSNSFFGQASSSTSCPAIADQDADLITIGQVAYQGFFELAAPPNQPITDPAQLQGKTIGVMSLGGTTDVLLDAMSLAVGLDPSKVRKVVTGTSSSGAAFLQRGDVDAFFVFPDSKFALRQMNVDLSYTPAHTYVPLPGDAILVSKSNASNPDNRDAIVKFLKVCRMGLDYMQNEKNFDELIQIVAKFNPVEGADVVKGRSVLEMLKVYYEPTGGVQRIVCDEQAWQDGVLLMEKIGLIKNKGLPLSSFLDNSFAKQAVAGM
ncbi:hypothetical protein DBV39_15885 [Orrella marina]|uniref:SsuA/THI5-like domain-containing protein n=1 Tax=Orrella marina TaxID=2163011 RepID=A0A2R4XMD2_9BURK|nr:hypothetical protein DBV39_15885 [Orrella marina]